MRPGSGEGGDTRTALRPQESTDDVSAASFVVSVESGPDMGKHLALDATRPSRLLIGQSPACELKLSDPHVSRRHAALELFGGALRLTDLGSTNGTSVNDVRVGEAFLRGGERVHLGATVLQVALSSAREKVTLPPAMRFGRVVGASAEMRRMYPLCERIAQSHLPVIIEGETGTGKELLAEALHETGPRANGPFVVFDCTAVPSNLAESMLFGHERGAFTGAVATRRGVFELAHGGTLFIDEVGDLEIALQAKLLRAIERSEVQRVGSEKWMKVNVRIIAATRRDLDQEIAAGRFRDDLFFRLAVTRVELPPLRKRRGDIAVLARHFWRSMDAGDRALPAEVLQHFEAYEWPGNVRELHNAVARQLALGELARPSAGDDDDGEESEATPSPPTNASHVDIIGDLLEQDLPLPRARELLVEAFERKYIERVLARYQGNVGRAAAASGIARRYFQLIRAKRARPSDE